MQQKKPHGNYLVLNSSLESNNEHFYYDVQNGVRGFNTDPARGADTFYPFSTIKTEKFSGFTTAGKEYKISLSQIPNKLICLKSKSGYGVCFPVDIQLTGASDDP